MEVMSKLLTEVQRKQARNYWPEAIGLQVQPRSNQYQT